MIGCYDFCGHYEWTFAWLEAQGGHPMVLDYWHDAISRDSQRHAEALIVSKGIDGMREYWKHTLDEEAADQVTTIKDDVFRIDMHQCPSKGFLLANNLQQYSDYCDHCMGWIGPLMKRAGFVIDHEHNHCGQCWWEIRASNNPERPAAPGILAGSADVRLNENWKSASTDHYERATHPDEKTSL
ncbi:MAG: hypothetical protein JNJ83_11330 [Verrucomicrobiaceae bacterium]|nr:hypothetical protein [Verrucomicrobiaceae bacterium]